MNVRGREPRLPLPRAAPVHRGRDELLCAIAIGSKVGDIKPSSSSTVSVEPK